jgi:hypothetical protein
MSVLGSLPLEPSRKLMSGGKDVGGSEVPKGRPGRQDSSRPSTGTRPLMFNSGVRIVQVARVSRQRLSTTKRAIVCLDPQRLCWIHSHAVML